MADSPQKALIESLAAALWRLERVKPRQEEAASERVEAALEDRVEFLCASHPASTRGALSVEARAVREVLQICHPLLKTQAADRQPVLSG